MNRATRYIATIAPVVEVALHGSADLAYWTERLATENLRPVALDGRAMIDIGAIESRFRGVRFREVTIAVAVADPCEPASRQAFFLVQAFNSSALFAFIEKSLFTTPYLHARIGLDARLPASFRVEQRGATLLSAAMSPDVPVRTPAREREERWEGRIFLPRQGGRPPGGRRYFFARLEGFTRSFSFAAPVDAVVASSDGGPPILQSLIDSGFRASEWAVRESGTHSRSKTFVLRRNDQC